MRVCFTECAFGVTMIKNEEIMQAADRRLKIKLDDSFSYLMNSRAFKI